MNNESESESESADSRIIRAFIRLHMLGFSVVDADSL